MKTLKEKIAVMQAADDGKPIEIKTQEVGAWVPWEDAFPPTFNWEHNDYRVAAKKIRYRRYLCKIGDEVYVGCFHSGRGESFPALKSSFVRWIDETAIEETV